MAIHNTSPTMMRILYISDLQEYQILPPLTDNTRETTYHTTDIEDAIYTCKRMAAEAEVSCPMPPVIHYFAWDQITWEDEAMEELE